MPHPHVIKASRDHRRRLGLYGAATAAADWWDPDKESLSVWAAYAPKGAASLAASYTDLSGNSHDAGVGVAPTWDAVDGWLFNGSTQYLTTTFVPQNDQSQSMIVQFTNVTQSLERMLAGCRTAAVTDRFYLSPYWPLMGISVLYGNGEYINIAPGMTQGNLAVAGNQGYRNGSADGAAIGAFGAPPTYTVWIGCMNQSNDPQGYLLGYIQALAIYDTALTAGQVLAIATAMAAL
jgi:hypothetical protein